MHGVDPPRWEQKCRMRVTMMPGTADDKHYLNTQGMGVLQGDSALLVKQIHNRAAQLQACCEAPPALAAASSHFARGDDCAAFATVLAAAAHRAPHCERDLFAVRAILQVTILQRLETRQPPVHECTTLGWLPHIAHQSW